ncbi:delta-60 repeat domain-containing protein [Catellatospora tritici]|uniref:delta-60 repeat domain-containing protein n=1 Tax=Catellatospora tritici TaxID=2851566 RepID=UPI001C2D6107|nr:delta-60 repeat domain-containing protein [Catellatospora tritici]MBV1855707.1 delta-60 repeat domain-containing protein [Catellatospora tritici]
MRTFLTFSTVLSLLLPAGAAQAVPAAAEAPTAPRARLAPAMPDTVTDDPVNWTPHITDGTVWAMAVVGDTVYVGGDFGGTTQAHSRAMLPRRNLMAFRLSDGEVTDLRVELDGPVFALAEGPDGSLLVGGNFTEVNGQRRRSLARLDPATGEVSSRLRSGVDGDVRTLAVSGSDLYVGGWYDWIGGAHRAGLARLDLDTDTVDPGFDAELADPVRTAPRTEAMALSPDGTRLVAIGNFNSARGLPRSQVVMLDVTGPEAVVTDWTAPFYGIRCDSRFDSYVRGVDYSPDGSWFVVVTTGHDSGPDLPCTAAARFEATGSGEHAPTWVNHTGGHSLYAVAVTGPAVYVGGHQLWQDNTYGQKTRGPGAVDRPGIAALDPVTGLALPWNPTRSRGAGVRAFAVSARGLLVGSDTDELGGEYHARIGLFPYAAG